MRSLPQVRRRHSARSRAFTLIEVVVVLLINILLVILLIGAVLHFHRKKEEAALKKTLEARDKAKHSQVAKGTPEPASGTPEGKPTGNEAADGAERQPAAPPAETGPAQDGASPEPAAASSPIPLPSVPLPVNPAAKTPPPIVTPRRPMLRGAGPGAPPQPPQGETTPAGSAQ